MRITTLFNDNWMFLKTSDFSSEIATDAGWEQITLPHTWNAVDGQDGGNDYWRGTAMYVKKFYTPQMSDGGRIYLSFEGVAMTADVMINGTKIVHHEGGYSTFRVDITDVLEKTLEKENLICVAVDNAENDQVYPQKADFTFYGGIYRNVKLIQVEHVHFELQKDGTNGIWVTPQVSLKDRKATVTVETWQNGGTHLEVTIGNQTKIVSVPKSHEAVEIVIEDVHLWDGLNDPYLYQATAKLFENDQLMDEVVTSFGCRKFEIDPELGFFLNGKSYPLRGVSRHQDREGLGNVISIKEQEEDMQLIREIGANTIRLAHYQHAQEFYDLCDKYGMIVWAEIPYITMHMDNGRANTISQMRELITQCYIHPSIICWGLSNEITVSGGVTEDILENHRILNELCHEMDSTRPTTMAHAFMLETDSEILEIPDINSYNLYYGWYLGELEDNDAFFNEYHAKYPNKIIGFSEYGADANPKYHTSEPEKNDYSEEYQCNYHEHILKMIEERPYLWATHVWNMFDFAADGRDEGGKHGVNQKGLISMDRKIKKDAFYLYKAYWSKEKFVHICGSRYVDRVGEETEIKVYSNLNQIVLYVDDCIVEKKNCDAMVCFRIPLTGKHRITAEGIEMESGRKLIDTITIVKVEKENPEYFLQKKEEVVNWFDKDTIDETCFSIKDKMGEITGTPAGAAIIGRMMEKVIASRGDVAKSTQSNSAIQKMLSQMTVEGLLKQAGDAISKEEIKGLNAALQKIKKPCSVEEN